MNPIKNNTILNFFLAVSACMILILSPCGVRNSIQEIMEVETTQTFNKSKSALSNCNTELNESISTQQGNQSVNHSKISVWFLLLFIGLLPFTNNQKHSSLYLIPISKEIKVPFYILYKRLKSRLH
jgi:hypothetical protein